MSGRIDNLISSLVLVVDILMPFSLSAAADKKSPSYYFESIISRREPKKERKNLNCSKMTSKFDGQITTTYIVKYLKKRKVNGQNLFQL